MLRTSPLGHNVIMFWGIIVLLWLLLLLLVAPAASTVPGQASESPAASAATAAVSSSVSAPDCRHLAVSRAVREVEVVDLRWGLGLGVP